MEVTEERKPKPVVWMGSSKEDLKEYPDAEEMSVKSQLTHVIQREIEKRDITQAEAGKIMGIDQSDVSRLLKGRLRTFSIERLFQFLNRLGYTVELKVVQERSRKRQAHTYVNAA